MTRRTATATCPRCGGTGHRPEYGHIASGACFRCRGTGRVTPRKASAPPPAPPARPSTEEAWNARLQARVLAFESSRDLNLPVAAFDDFAEAPPTASARLLYASAVEIAARRQRRTPTAVRAAWAPTLEAMRREVARHEATRKNPRFMEPTGSRCVARRR